MKLFGGILCVALIGLLFATCSKGGLAPSEEDPNHVINLADSTYPVIEITTPTTDQVFSSGNVISITGKLTDNSLFQGSIKITDDASGAVVKEQLYEIHGLPSYNFNLSYTASVAKLSNYTVTVAFEDHGYNMSSKTVKIRVNP